jgi:O-antigen ligase
MSSVYIENDNPSLKFHEWISLISCFLMSIGMVCSRLLLSIGMLLLFLNTLQPQKLAENWMKFRHSAFAWFSLLFFVAYVLSGFWSEDQSNWLAMVQIKLPFLIFPFALMGLPLANRRWLKLMVGGLLIALLGGMIYSFSISNSKSYEGGFHMPSPMEGDYIRFTIVLVLAMVFIVYLIKNAVVMRINRFFVMLLIIWFAIAVAYIHIQAAKSGIVSYYIFYGMFVLYYGFTRRKPLQMFGLIAIGLIGFLAFSKLPVMSSQIDKMSYERQVLETADTAGYRKTGSVVPRINSYKVAADVISKNFFIGVGAGDMKEEMDKVYDEKYPNLIGPAKLLPHNALLCSFIAIGVPMSIVTLVMLMVSPFFKRENRSNIYLITTWIILFFGLMIEPMLEVQFGIFVFLFFMYLWTEIPVIHSNKVK